MRIQQSMLSALLLTVFLSALSYATVPDRISGALTNGQTVTLKGNVHRKALPQFDQGPVDPAMSMGTVMLMTVPTAAQQKAITQLLAQQQDPKSKNYHKWLTPEQYADRFGLSPNDMQKMAAWLKAKGLTVIDLARGRNWISFTGTAAQVHSAFGTEIHHYKVNGELHYANATAPAIPAALGGIVVGLRGLHDFHPRPLGIRRNAGVRPDYNSNDFGSLVAPGDIATIYDINALYTAGIDGTGQKLAVMGQTDIYLADLANFRSGFGLSAINCTTNSSGVITACSDPHLSYVLGGTDPGLRSKTGDISEADLDLEWAGAVAREAQLVYVNASSTFISFRYAIDHNVAPVISLSYGLCEFDDNFVLDSSGQPLSDEAEMQKASSMGITFVNSSGDTGGAECDFGGSGGTLTSTNLATQGLAVSYPASSPQVTGVGGTAIPLANFSSTYWGTSNGTDGNTALSYIPEQVWNDDAEIAEYCQANAGTDFCKQGGTNPIPGWVLITDAQTAQQDIGISSSGGGVSNCAIQTSDNGSCVSGFTQPTWQTVSISGQASARFSPDVSFLATPNFPGYIFCTPMSELGLTGTTSSCDPGGSAGITNALALNNPSIIGGTSASAPVFAGIVALMNQYLGTTGLGNVNPTLYALAATPSNGAFHPVTTGDNNVYCEAGTPAGTVTDPWPTNLQCPASGVFGFSASNSDSTTGYNLVSGLGSVDANNLALAWNDLVTQPGFSLSPSSASLNAVAGVDSNSTTITATPLNGFAGTVTFACSGGLPAGATCSFSPIDSMSSTLIIQTSSSMAGVQGASVIVTGTSGTVSRSTVVSLTVTSPNQSFTLALSSGTPQVSQGSSVNVTLTLTGSDGFNSPVTYTCTDPAPQSTCTGPSGVTASTSVSFLITTTAPTVAARQGLGASRIFYATLLPGLLGLVLTFSSRKRSLNGLRFVGLILALGLSTMWLASCGGGSGSTKNAGTPTGAYTITVSATTGGANPITGQTTFTLNVVH